MRVLVYSYNLSLYISMLQYVCTCIHTTIYARIYECTNDTYGLTDRQAGRQAGGQTDRQAGRQAGRQTDRQAGRQMHVCMYGCVYV